MQDTIPIHAARPAGLKARQAARVICQTLTLTPAPALRQVQDTIPIHAAHMSQQVALRALRAAPGWLRGRIDELRQNRRAPLHGMG